MKIFDFEITDDTDMAAPAALDDSLLPMGDACSLEDLLRLVDMGDDDCIDRNRQAFLCDEEALIWALSYIMDTPLGRALACDARFEEWSVEVDDIPDNIPVIDGQLRVLILPRGTPSVRVLSATPHYRAEFLSNMARGLRLMWQDMNNLSPFSHLTVDDQILWERLRTADLDTAVLRMAWDMRGDDDGALWRHMIAGDLGDVATVSACLWATADLADLPKTEENSPLLSDLLLPCFQAWLGTDILLAACDSRTLAALDYRLQRDMRDVCGTHTLRATDILALGRLPEGGSYLAPVCRTLVHAEDMRRIPDPVNEVHMQQIIEDCAFLNQSPLVFRDSALQEKIFPQQGINTLA